MGRGGIVRFRQVHAQGSAAGVSSRMLEMHLLTLVLRLASTTLKKGCSRELSGTEYVRIVASWSQAPLDVLAVMSLNSYLPSMTELGSPLQIRRHRA